MKLSDRAFELAKHAYSAAKHADAKAILETEYPDIPYDQIQEIYLTAAHMADAAYEIGDKIRLGETSEDNVFHQLGEQFPGFSDATYKTVIAHGLFISR
jgi:hypothetical protein